MTKFFVSTELTISVHTFVEANDEEQAKIIAMDRPVMDLCHQCASANSELEWVTSGELDGLPEEDKVRVEKAKEGQRR